jgi:hypothetical protein
MVSPHRRSDCAAQLAATHGRLFGGSEREEAHLEAGRPFRPRIYVSYRAAGSTARTTYRRS